MIVTGTGRRSAAVTNPDTRTTSSAPGSIAPRRSRLESLARRAVGAAWTATGPVRWGAGIALRTTEVVVSEVAARVSPRSTDPAAGRPDAAPGGPDPAPGSPAAPQTSSGLLDRVVAPLRPVIDAVVRAALEGLDLTRVVLDKVDLDTVVAAVDLDAAVAGVDLDTIVERVDLDAIVERVDIERIIGRLDLNAIVASGVDLDRIVDRLDLDAIVERVDIERIVDRLDLGAIVARVDIDPIVARVDFDAAIARIDIIGIAENVVDGIDLAGIIRDSTGSLASEAVHGVRVQGQQADDAIGQFVGRMLGRRRQLDGSPIGSPPTEEVHRPSTNGRHVPPPTDRN